MELRTASEQYGLRKNPLPPPPQPVSTEHVPSFSQAMAHDQVSLELPSVTGSRSHALPFKAQGHRYHKGKAKSLDHRLVSPSQNSSPLPTQQAKMNPSEEGPALVSHLDHHSPMSGQRPPSPALPQGLKLRFENTNQPLDPYELTQTYLREYSQGVLDGRLMAGKHSSRSHQPRASTSRFHSEGSLHERNESIDARSNRSIRSTQGHETQSISGSSMADPPSRPLHQRHNTVPSIVSSVESSSIGSGSQTRNPTLADLLSNNSPRAPPPRRPVASLPPSPPPLNPNPSPIASPPQPFDAQQLESLSLLQTVLTRANSPASSRISKASTWGTLKSSSTNHTLYSLLGLRDFRESFAVSPPRHNGSRIGFHRASQYSLNSWHGSAASSLSPMSQDRVLSSNGYHHEGENENAMRRDDELVNPSYSRDSTGSRRQRSMEPQRLTRGRNQPLPALSPSSSFSFGEAIITEEDNRSDSNFMTFGNALGLELSADPIPISAPTPIVPHQTFLRSFSSNDET